MKESSLFSKYHKIDNIEDGEVIRYPGEYIATEKVHGANFSIYILPNNTLRCAKRNCLLSDYDNDESLSYNDDFFGYNMLLEELRPTLMRTAVYIREAFSIRFDDEEDPLIPRQNVIIIYGELFGGIFRGKSLSNPVQKGVEYCPDIRFYAFDIKINERFLNYRDFESICEKCELFYAKALIIGSLERVLALDPTFPSTISGRLGLGTVEGNMAEGYIIKPLVRILNSHGGRLIWKHKSPRFSENQLKTIPLIAQENADSRFMFETIFPKICSNRLDNIMSHGPDIKDGEEKKILVEMLIRDALMESHYRNSFKPIRKKLTKLLLPEALRIVEIYLKNSIGV